MKQRSRASVLAMALAVAAPRAHAQGTSAPATPPEEVAAEEVPIEEEAPVEEAPAEPAPVPPTAPGGAAAKASAPAVAAEADAAELELDPARPPPRGRGVVWGMLRSGANGEPLLEAQVTVARTKQQVLSDLDGRYRLELRPGIYELRFWAELHRAEIVRGVRVEAGKVVQLDSVVPSDETAVDVVEVETEADRAAVEGQILTRQRAAAVGDSVGRAEIARTPDRNAAQAAQRLVGATVVGGRFVYVRGLGERYTNALLNDAPLPSPEPDRAAVPLDLFPTMAINSLTIVKTFTPDVPGDFAGGSVRIETREIPSRFVLQASVSGGYNSQATFRTHEGARTGGSLDWLGIDDGTRALPGGFPTYKLAVGSQRPDGTAVTGAEVDAASRSINSYFSTRSRTLPPDHSMSVVAGNGFSLGGDQKLGVLGAVSYGRSYELQRGRTYNEFGRAADGSLNGERVYRINLGGEKVTWGALGSVTYQANRDHRFTLLGMHSQIADNAAQETTGFNNSRNAQVHDQRLLFVERGLNLGQLRGEHRFPGLDRAELGWSGWISDAARNEPDTRNIAYNRAEGSADYTYVDDDFSGRHFWSNQTELVRGGKVDWTQPLGATESKVKTGVFVNLRERDFDSRSLPFRRSDELSIRDRESYAKLNCPAPAAGGTPDFQACGDALMNGANLGPVVRLREATLPEDAYRANLDVYAGYLMSDVALSRRVRVIAGERVEVTRQETTPFDQFNPDLRLNSGRIRSTDLLPSLSAVFELDPRTKVRASATRTLARPQLRELAPFAYTDYFGGRFVSGNPDLTLTRITNADVRVEHFPTLKEVLALSLFYKRFQDPIETVAIAAGDKGTITFQNAQAGDLYGVEIEARKSLEFVAPELRSFTAIANLTVAQSSVQLDGAARDFLTSAERPMMNQAPYVLNLALDWEHTTGTTARVLYNVQGARIEQVGAQGLPDAYLQPRHVIDLYAGQDLGEHFQVRFVATDLLNAPFVTTQGERRTDDNVMFRYTNGSRYTLTATYTH